MSLWETFTLAVKNISGSKMRTFLTMLGIIIGVCAVIVIVGLGNGMAGYMEDSFAEMGTNTLTVSIMGRGTSRTVSEEQMYQIVEDNAGYLDQISPTVSMTGSVKIGSTTYSSTSVSGVGETWFDMKGYEVAQGRGIEYMDIVNRKKVCVVGSYVAQTCFGGNAVGQRWAAPPFPSWALWLRRRSRWRRGARTTASMSPTPPQPACPLPAPSAAIL